MRTSVIILLLLGLTACGEDYYAEKIARGKELCASHGGLDRISGGGKTRPKAFCNDGSVFHRRTGEFLWRD